MRQVTVPALAFALLLAAAAPAGSQTRPRRVNPVSEVYSESGPRSRTYERAEGERPVRRGRWRRLLFEAGLAAAAMRTGRSCTPSRGVLGRLPR